MKINDQWSIGNDQWSTKPLVPRPEVRIHNPFERISSSSPGFQSWGRSEVGDQRSEVGGQVIFGMLLQILVEEKES